METVLIILGIIALAIIALPLALVAGALYLIYWLLLQAGIIKKPDPGPPSEPLRNTD